MGPDQREKRKKEGWEGKEDRRKMKRGRERGRERDREGGRKQEALLAKLLRATAMLYITLYVNLQTQIPIIFSPSLWPGCQLTVVTVC